VKKFEDTFIRFDRMYECDVQTDGQMHGRTLRDDIGHT